MVPGVRVHGASIVDKEVALDEQFRPVPVPNLLGVPLVYKKQSGTGGDDTNIRSNVIVRFMADPDDGLAPIDWQYGGAAKGPAPPVVLARKDALPFSQQEWDTLDEYMATWLDALSEAEDDRLEVSQRMLTPQAFQAYVDEQRELRPCAFLSLRFPLGSIVLAEGLSVSELNGKEGEVVQYSRDRVGVRYPDRDAIGLKPERLTIVRAPVAVELAAEAAPSPEAKRRRQRDLQRQEAMAISKRFVECLHEDTFPEMGDLHLFGVGSHYHSRSQEVLAVWQGAAKHGDLTAEQLGEALEKGELRGFFEDTCRKLAATRTPNSTYANELIKNNFAAVEWDDL